MRVPGWRGVPWVGLLGVPGKGVQGRSSPSPGLSTRVCASCRPAVPGKPSDMWALGVVLFTMLYGQFPSTTASHRSSSARSRPRSTPSPSGPLLGVLGLSGSAGRNSMGRLGVLGQDLAPARPPECPLPSCIRDGRVS